MVWITKPHHPKLSSKPIPKTFGFFSMRDSLLCRVVLKHCEIADDGVSQSSSGAAIASILEEDKAYEIALCAGDDQTDESMFKLCMPRLLSVKVGNGATQAQFRVANQAAFRRFLDETVVKL